MQLLLGEAIELAKRSVLSHWLRFGSMWWTQHGKSSSGRATFIEHNIMKGASDFGMSDEVQ